MPRQATHLTKPKPEKNPRRDPTAAGQRDAAVNRIASHIYFLLEKFEAGIALTGTEVKSIRAGEVNLKDAYGLIKDVAVPGVVNAETAGTVPTADSNTEKAEVVTPTEQK